MKRSVSIQSRGRSGKVTYHEDANWLECYWEFGGNVVAIVQCGDEAVWREKHAWAVTRRPEILQFIAEEVVRQNAPDCSAEIELPSGDVLIHQHAAARLGDPPDVATTERSPSGWVFRFSALRSTFGMIVLMLAILFGAAFWFGGKLFAIDPGKGSPIGLSLRSEQFVATLIQTVEPYIPSLHRDHGRDTYSVSLFLVPLDGARTRLIPIRQGVSSSVASQSRLFGSDGSTIWFDVAGLGGVNLSTFGLRTQPEVDRGDMRSLPRAAALWPIAATPEQYLASGLLTSPTTWLGLHSSAEATRDFKPNGWLKRVVDARDAKQFRRFHLGQVEHTARKEYLRIISMQPLGSEEYLNAAFLRMDAAMEPLRPSGGTGALMVFTSEPGLRGKLMMARVDDRGQVVWQVDTELDRFRLQQILPGAQVTAFVGTRPPVPNAVSEPLLVTVEHATGRREIHALAR